MDITSGASSSTNKPAITECLIRSRFESLLSEDSGDEEVVLHENVVEPQPGQIAGAGNGANLDQNTNRNAGTSGRSASSMDNDEIILSAIWLNDRVGAAYYNVATSELYVMEDIKDDADFSVTAALYRQTQPGCVVTVTGKSFLTALKKLVLRDTVQEEHSSTSSAERNTRAVLMTMSKKEYNYDRCYHRVRCLKLACEPKDADNAERVTMLNSVLNFNYQAMIYSLGLLLVYIDKHWNRLALDFSGRPSFASINCVSLRDFVMVDEDTYEALNIVHKGPYHRFVKFESPDGRIQGLNLFALLNRCQSVPGVRFLWKTLRQPTRNINVLNQRYDTIDFFLDPRNFGVVENLTSLLKHVSRLTVAILGQYSMPRAKTPDWQRLHKTVSHVIYIADICETYRDKNELCRKIADSVTEEMHYIKYFIEYVVDFEASKRENSVVVKPNVDPLLDELNHLRGTLPELLTRMGQKDMQNNLALSIASCNMLYLPYIGYVLAVDEWEYPPPENLDFPGFEFKFTINNKYYYKSPAARELDETIGDVVLKITNRQIQITLKLVRYITKHAGSLLNAVELCAELDTLLAFYASARDNNYTRPNVVEGPIIAIKQGRHPLLELTATCVPNDTRSGQESSVIKVLTGPHACGKSVYLKQVALIVFMAHIGCFVPAESATIGVVTHVLTQLHTMETMELNASAFLQNLRQINLILKASTPNCLIIIDEFGKGTSEISGLSLLAAILKSFIDRGDRCPHVLVATHIHRVVQRIPRSALVEEQTFDYVVEGNDRMVFLYRLIPGSATQSRAHAAARSAGLSEHIVKQATEVYEAVRRGECPSRLPEAQPQATATHIAERLLDASAEIPLEELKLWVRQTIVTARKK